MRFRTLAVIALVLSGCTGHPVDCAIGIPHGDCAANTLGAERVEQVRESYVEQCTAYGFKPDTDAFAECLMRLDQGHHACLSIPMANGVAETVCR